MLIELLQWASVTTIAQLSAGRTALRNKIRDQKVVLCKEEFNNSLDLCETCTLPDPETRPFLYCWVRSSVTCACTVQQALGD